MIFYLAKLGKNITIHYVPMSFFLFFFVEYQLMHFDLGSINIPNGLLLCCLHIKNEGKAFACPDLYR